MYADLQKYSSMESDKWYKNNWSNQSNKLLTRLVKNFLREK